jgi:hypothetical protein
VPRYGARVFVAGADCGTMALLRRDLEVTGDRAVVAPARERRGLSTPICTAFRTLWSLSLERPFEIPQSFEATNATL